VESSYIETLGDAVNFGTGLGRLPGAAGIAVVLHQEDKGKLLSAGPIERFEEFDLTGRSFARRDVGDTALSFGTEGARDANCMDVLGRRNCSLRHQVQFTGREVFGHVPAI
jgi:hypothetical protein